MSQGHFRHRCVFINFGLEVGNTGGSTIFFRLLQHTAGFFPTKSPASGAGDVSEHRLMEQIGRVRDILCAWISVFLQYLSAYAVTVVM
jgi:hypothetical protein